MVRCAGARLREIENGSRELGTKRGRIESIDAAPFNMGRVGLEPTTVGLKVRCSAD